MCARSPLACIVPPGLLVRLVHQAEPERRRAILQTLMLDQSFRQRRAENGARMASAPALLSVVGAVGGQPQRMIYDQQNQLTEALGTLVRAEGAPPSSDEAVNQAYDAFGATYDFYWQVLGRNSIDDRGMTIIGLVHYGQDYDNAFWDGQGHMFFGDGDGQALVQTTRGLDVIGHELTHGVTQHTANLAYQGQSGALNESVSDVFGSLVKQRHLNQAADQADWLIGPDIVGPELAPALRSMKAPGTANPHDDQPADMDGYVTTGEDSGGVHTNSGIPNRCFYVAATAIGGNAWEKAGRIWYATLRDPQLRPDAQFRDFALVTLRQAQQIYGQTSPEAQAVGQGWEAVKVAL